MMEYPGKYINPFTDFGFKKLLGVDKGKTKRSLEIAKDMLKNGFDLDAITKTTGISKEAILW